jgi:hypothetical protein
MGIYLCPTKLLSTESSESDAFWGWQKRISQKVGYDPWGIRNIGRSRKLWAFQILNASSFETGIILLCSNISVSNRTTWTVQARRRLQGMVYKREYWVLAVAKTSTHNRKHFNRNQKDGFLNDMYTN